MKKETATKVLFWLIIIIAILVRIFAWPNALKEVNCDEAMTAINARAIVQTGMDIYKTSYPVYLEAWQYTGQSVMLVYLMAISIKLLGATLVAVRLPLLLISILSLFVAYDFTKRVTKNKTIALIVLALLAISPWHIMQARWSLDCNLFPHFMLLSIYLLYLGLRTPKRKWMYASMISFALTMYTYGLAVYVVPLFLLIMAIYLMVTKEMTIKELLICILLYMIVTFPIILMYITNLFKLGNIQLGPITIQYFEQNQRLRDMLIFSTDRLGQFWKNIDKLVHVLVLQYDRLEWNASYGYGVIYVFSIIFTVIGSIEWNRKNPEQDKLAKLVMDLWIVLSLILGMVINNTNINKLNVLWYPFMMLTGYGIYQVYEIMKKKKIVVYGIIILYSISFILFQYNYYTKQIAKIESSTFWSEGLNQAVIFAQSSDKEVINLDTKITEKGSGRVFLNYVIQFNETHAKRYELRNIEQLNENKVYIMPTKEVKEEWKEQIRAIFYQYAVIWKEE